MISLRANDVPHIVRKLSTKAITFISTSLQSEACTQSYGPTKSQETQFRDKMTFGCWPRGQA
jgi:hypothetical protein